MVVWTMKCVGYDNKFQKDISKTYPKWVPPLTKGQEAKAREQERSKQLKEQEKQHRPAEKQRKKAASRKSVLNRKALTAQ